MIHNIAKAGENLKHFRRLFGLSQKDIADKFYVGISTVSQWENGKRAMDYETVTMLANFFGLTTDDFLSDLNENNNLDFNSVPQIVNDIVSTCFHIYDLPDDKDNEYFKLAYRKCQTIFNSQDNFFTFHAELAYCINIFSKSLHQLPAYETYANIATLILFHSSFFLPDAEEVAGILYSGTNIDKKLKNNYLKNRSYKVNEREEFIEKYFNLFLICIEKLKEASEWSQLGDFYLALSFLMGINALINNRQVSEKTGHLLLCSLSLLNNPYAETFLNVHEVSSSDETGVPESEE